MAPGGPIRGASSCRTQHSFEASTLERCRVLVVSHGTLAAPSTAAAAVPRHPAPWARAAFSSAPNDSGSIWRLSASSPCHHAVAVADTPCEDQAVHQEPAVDTYSLLHKLHTLCDGSQLAATAQLREWAGEAQAHLGAMSLQEVAYIASCLQHYEYVWQQQQCPQSQPQQHLQRSTGACTSFCVDAGFLQQACAAACGASTTIFQDLHHFSNKNEQRHLPQQQPPAQQQLLQSLQHLLELLQWASREVVQQRQQLQHQLQCTQQPQQQGVGQAALSLTDLQAHRDQLQQLVQAQQQAQQLLQHPLLLLALPHANCWQLHQLLVCSGQLGVAPAADWMGHWLAAARHAMADLVLPYQQWQDPDHQQQHYGAHAQQHLQEYRAGAAAAYMQLVGLLSGLAAAHVKPPEAWAAAWQQAALAVLAAQPCFAALEGSGTGSSGSGSFFSMLQQLLHAVSVMQLRLSADFWTGHEGLLQQQVLWFSPAELLRVLQLHQQSNLRPSRACIKYLAAKLEQHLQQQQEGGASAVPGSSSSSSGVVLQLVMVTCGLSVWGVRLHLRSVAQLLLCLDAHKARLPLNVMLQVLAILATRLARVYTASLMATNSSSSSSSDSFSSSSSSSSDSAGSAASLSTISTDGEDPADMHAGVIGSTGVGGGVGLPAASSAACALERLLMFAADQLTLSYMGQAGSARPEAASPSNSHTGSAQTPADCGPLIKLLQISAALARNGARGGGSQIDTTDSVTSYAAAAAAAAVGGPRAPSSHGSFRDLVHKLHPLTAAVAVTCTPSQLVLLMGAWNQLGLSSAWRFGGFRRGYKRLGQQEVLRVLSNAELAAAVEATARLPPTQSVVHALAAEVRRRQAGTVTQQQQEKGAEGHGQASAAAAAAPQPLSPAQLVAVVCAVPGLNAYWPTAVMLQLLQRIQGLVQHTLNPSQQWRLWNALQELQQQWKPSVMAAAAAAAAADAPAPGHTGHSPAGEGEGAGGIHPAVTYAAAAAAASFKATGAGAANSGLQAAAMDLPANSSTDIATSSSSSSHQQRQLMRLLDELQDQVAAALARVQPDPDALPVEAAPPKVPRPLHAAELEAGGPPATESAAADVRPLLDAAGRRTQAQVLAAFAKAQKSLLSPHCSGAALVKVLEGLLLLLSVPRYAKAAKKNETVRRAVLRALEAAAWPDLLAQALDIQALLLLTAASRGLGSPPDSPYSQLLQQETSRVLADAPLTSLAAALGRVAALQLPRFSLNFTVLRFWVGRLAQAARQSPEAALAVLVPLTQLGFKPAGGAAALVLQPLLDAAATAGWMYSSNGAASGEFSSADINSSSTSSTACLRPAGVLALTRVLADMGLNPDAANAQQLLKAHVGLMKHYSVGQLLQLSRCVMRLELLTTSVQKPSTAAMAQGVSDDASSSSGISSETEARQAGCWLAPAAGAWVEAWLKQLIKRGTAQMDTAQVVELQLLLCELDFVPWHLSAAHSGHINASLQQLQTRLAAVPADWQSPLAAAVQASYHSTQELRRLVAARARRMAHQQGSSNAAGGAAAAAAASATPPATLSSVRAAIASAMQPGDGAPVEAANAGALTETDSSSIAGATGVSRRFVSRKTAAAAAAAGGASAGVAQSGAGASGVSGFSYPSNPVGHQLQVLSHSKRVLLWAAIKHHAVRPLTAAWVESCCFNILLGGQQHLTPAVATGLLLAVADVQHSSTTSSNERSTATTAAEGGAPVRSEAALRDRALTNLTGELVGRVVAALQVLRGALFVQTFGALASARVSAVTATQAYSRSAGQPLHVLAPRQQQLLLAAVARVLPVLQPPQLPLLVSSMARLRLQPDVLWLSTALEALAVKAAAAAAAGQPAQQLLLLAAAKQLLVCGGVLLLPTATVSARPDAVVATDHQGEALQVLQAGPARTPSAATAAMLPVASALRALAAGAAQVLSSMFRRSQHRQPLQQAGSAATPEPPHALAAAAAVAAAFGDAQGVSDTSSVALLLSSLATQLQLAQAATTPAAQQAATAAATTALGPAAVNSRSLVDQGDGWAAADFPQQQPQEQQQQLLAAAVLLNAGSQVPRAPDSAGGAAGVSAVRVARRSTQGQAWQAAAWHSMHRPERERQHARQQQQQRMLLGQLLQLQFLKASEQLVQAVWQGGYQQQPEPVLPAAPPPSAAGADLATGAAVYATQVLLDPTGQLMQPRPTGQQEQQQEAQQVEADGVAPLHQGPLRPHRLVAQGLQVQFDGLLRKAFMVAAAAAAGERQHREQQLQPQQQQGSSEPAAERQGEPWWLPGSRDVSRLMQSAADEGAAANRRAGDSGRGADDAGCSSSSSGGAGIVDDAAASAVVGGGLDGGVAGGEPVLVLPVMSRALDAQFARLMREVLHSSLAAGGANRGGG